MGINSEVFYYQYNYPVIQPGFFMFEKANVLNAELVGDDIF